MKKESFKMVNSGYRNLFLLGAVVPLIVLAFYLIEVLSIIFEQSLEPYPVTVNDWFSLFQRNKLLGLLYLNALDIVSIALLGLLFLALYVTLKSENRTWITIATFFAFLGIAVFVTIRSATLAVLALGDQYAAAAKEAERSLILAAGQAVGALGNPTPQTTGFFFMAVAVLIISIIMLKSGIFNKVTAWAGILAAVLTCTDDLSLVIMPTVAGVLMGIAGLFWVTWWLLVSLRLFKLGSLETEKLI